MNYARLSFRSLLMRWRQYVSLFLVCAVGTGVSLFSLFLVDGMLDSLYMKARIYYAGSFQFLGGKNSLRFPDSRPFVQKLSEVLGEEAQIFPRMEFLDKAASFYYEGQEARVQVIKGVDFSLEQELFSAFNYVQGSAAEMTENGILISDKVASTLCVSVGDEITFFFRDSKGHINTAQFVVRGIFCDSSVFGVYTAYVDINNLRKIYLVDEFYANRIGIFFSNPKRAEKHAAYYQQLLSEAFNMYDLVENKYDFYDLLLAGKFDEETYALIQLSANLDDLKIVISAMRIVANLVICALLVIVVVGIASTWRVIVMKRIQEIGIYKAIGMSRGSVRPLLASEALVLLLLGCAAGFAVCLSLEAITGKINLSFIPAFDIFLSNGFLLPLRSAQGALAVFGSAIVTTLAAVVFSVQKAVKITPVQALGVTE